MPKLTGVVGVAATATGTFSSRLVSDMITDGAALALDFTSGVGSVAVEGRVENPAGSSSWMTAFKYGSGGAPVAMATEAATADSFVILAGEYSALRVNGALMSAGSVNAYLCGRVAR